MVGGAEHRTQTHRVVTQQDDTLAATTVAVILADTDFTQHHQGLLIATAL